MKKLITERLAINGVLSILTLVILLHLLIMFGIIPYTIVWGGRIENQNQMLVFEIISIVMNLIMLTVVAIKAGFIKISINRTIVKIALWLMFGLFILNTIGNLFSTNQIEKLLFTPLTLLLALFCYRLSFVKDEI